MGDGVGKRLQVPVGACQVGRALLDGHWAASWADQLDLAMVALAPQAGLNQPGEFLATARRDQVEGVRAREIGCGMPGHRPKSWVDPGAASHQPLPSGLIRMARAAGRQAGTGRTARTPPCRRGRKEMSMSCAQTDRQQVRPGTAWLALTATTIGAAIRARGHFAGHRGREQILSPIRAQFEADPRHPAPRAAGVARADAAARGRAQRAIRHHQSC
jgi:hypothetical protein